MCLNPIKIRVNNAYLSHGSLQSMYLNIPCGRCSECMQLRRDQFYLRTYWEARNCFDQNGYVYFETLSYRTDDLPHLSWWFPEFEGKSYDYPCFCYEHYRNFMKRLRINLERGVFEPDYLEIQKLRKEKNDLKKMRSKYPLRKKIDKINNGPKREWIENRINEINYEIEDLSKTKVCWNVDKNLKSVVVSEYGSDDIYRDDKGRLRKATFRPHYHLLFFVNMPDLPSTKLAEYIYKSWKHGKTDSVDVDGNLRTSYIRHHNTIGQGSSRNTELELRKVSKYISKYITKDSKNSDKIKARVQYAGERVGRVYEEYIAPFKNNQFGKDMVNVDTVLYGPQNSVHYEFDEDGKITKLLGEKTTISVPGLQERIDRVKCMRLVRLQKDLDKIKRLVDGFHLQGLGYGLYALDPKNFDEEELMEKGTMTLPDSLKVVKHIPVPQYYLRHLYYDCITPKDNWRANSPTFVLNERGKEFKKKSLYRFYNNKVKGYTNLYLNMSEIDKMKVDFILDGRSLSDYAIYKCFYQDRIKHDYLCANLDDAINRISNINNLEGDIYLDKDRFVYTKSNKWTVENGVYGPTYDISDYEDYCKDNMINQWSSPEFCNFDFIDDIFEPYIKKNAEEKELKFNHLEEIKKRIKGNN